MVSGDRRDRVGQVSVTRKTRTKTKRDGEGAAVAWKRTRRYGEKLGQFACLSARPVRGIYMNPSLQRYNVHYTEREMGKVKSKFKECCPAGDRVHGVVCEGDPVFKVKAQVYCMSKRSSGREVEGSSGGRILMARGTRRGAKRKERRV